MKTIAFTLMLASAFFACKPKFTYIEYKEEPSSSYSTRTKLTDVLEYVILENYPRDTAKLIELMLHYRDSVGRSYDSLLHMQHELEYYGMWFYKKNWSTRKFLYTKQEKEDNLNNREGNYIGGVIIFPCDENKRNKNMSLLRVSVDINLNNSESFDLLGYNCKKYIIRNDCDSLEKSK